MAKSLDGVLIKKAHKKQRYTKKQLEEFKLCADSEHGPLYFLDNFFNIPLPPVICYGLQCLYLILLY